VLTERSLPGSVAPALAVPRDPLRLPPGWPLYVLFGGLFVWWFLGVSGVIQAILAVAMLVALVMRGQVLMPRAFLFWLLFLGAMLLSATQIQDFPRAVAFAWRASLYVSGAVVFLYVFNTPREKLPAHRVMNVLAAFWVLTVVGGLVGMAFPRLTFDSLLGILLPEGLTSSEFVHALVTPSTTGGRAFTGTGIYRVKAPFIYTNQWGSAFALSLPFALAALGTMRSRLWRNAMVALLVASVVPLVFSLDRGSWLSAAAGVTYGVFRLARTRGRRGTRLARTLRTMIIGGVVVAGLILITPLGDLIIHRINRGYGDEHRQALYVSSLILIERSPLLGYGGTVALSAVNPSAPPGPSVGTHGQFWTVMISNGIPALFFFLGWFAVALFRTGRRMPDDGERDVNARFWCHVAIFTALVQMPYYELLPWGLFIVMAAAAVAWREQNVPYGRVGVPEPAPSSLVPQRVQAH
jgi:polysaccharide biosynthesis protein PslJ